MPTLMGSNLFGPRDTPILRDARPLGDKADNNASNRDDEPASRVPVAVDKFPFKLHAILADIEASEMSHIVSFQPHGRAFRVHKIGLFESQVLPKWYRQSKFASFQRQLNIYDFRRITQGPDKGSYYHERFIRGQPDLARNIPRMFLKGTGTRRPDCPFYGPNFYAMPAMAATKTKTKRLEAPTDGQRDGVCQDAWQNESCQQDAATSTVVYSMAPLDLLVQAASTLCSVPAKRELNCDALSTPFQSTPSTMSLQCELASRPNGIYGTTKVTNQRNESSLLTVMSTHHNLDNPQSLHSSVLDLARFRTPSHTMEVDVLSPAFRVPLMLQQQQLLATTMEQQRNSLVRPGFSIYDSISSYPATHMLPFPGWNGGHPSLPFASLHSAFEPSAIPFAPAPLEHATQVPLP